MLQLLLDHISNVSEVSPGDIESRVGLLEGSVAQVFAEGVDKAQEGLDVAKAR